MKTSWLWAVVVALLLTACASIAESAEPVLRQLLDEGKITVEQYDALMAALMEGGEGWLDIIAKIGGVAATVVLSVFGVKVALPKMMSTNTRHRLPVA